MAKTNHDSGSARRALNEPSNEDTEDVVGDRTRLIEIGMAAVFLACVLFAIARFVMAELSGLRTPWWGNALAASMVALIYAWFRRDPVGRSTIAVHVTAFAATVAMLIPSAYGMSASKWWLSLVGFSAVLMARRREALVWSTVTVVLMPIVAMLEPHILIVGAIGEPPIELALSTFFYVVLLLGLTLAFRRVAFQQVGEGVRQLAYRKSRRHPAPLDRLHSACSARGRNPGARRDIARRGHD